MASNHTSHLGLSLWAASDAVLRADFNSDNQRIDDAFEFMPRMSTGSYLGGGVYGSESSNRLSFSFTPYLVVVVADDGTAFVPGTIFVRDQEESAGLSRTTSSSDSLKLKLTWGSSHVSWYCNDGLNGSPRDQLNEEGVTYRYFALGM